MNKLMTVCLIATCLTIIGCSEIWNDCSEWKLISEETSTSGYLDFQKYERCIDGGYQIKWVWYIRGKVDEIEILTYYD